MRDDLTLVTFVASQLSAASAATAKRTSERVLAEFVGHFNLDFAFLRHNDDDIHASRLVAEWPPRSDDAPELDPSAVIHFSAVDPILAFGEHTAQTIVIKPDQLEQPQPYWIPGHCEGKRPSLALAPLMAAEVVTGVLGIGKYRGGTWRRAAIEALEAAASMFAQFQARMVDEQNLRRLAEHDDLTGLHNRRALVTYVSQRLKGPGPVALLYLDLDRLKLINDCLGHTAGDLFIQVFAERLRVWAGGNSLLARVGGDEFVVVPEQAMPIDAAETFGQRLRGLLSTRLRIGADTVRSTVSIGVATGLAREDDAIGLIKRADEAVLVAKRTGGNQVVVAPGQGMSERALREAIEQSLHDDTAEEMLALHYLPEIDLSSGAVVAVEALARWPDAGRGFLLPNVFNGLPEAGSLTYDLSRWVLRTACADLCRWRSHGLATQTRMHINVSPAQLFSRGFVASVAETIDEFGIDGPSLCLDINERALTRDVETTRRTLRELHEVGIKAAIDDFGIGYTVLSHLASLPIDTLKIDMTLVRDLGSHAADLAIVRAILGLAEGFRLQVVAEGVDTTAVALTLMRHGCHRMQGYLLSPPLAAEVLEVLLSIGWIEMRSENAELARERDALRRWIASGPTSQRRGGPGLVTSAVDPAGPLPYLSGSTGSTAERVNPGSTD